MSAQKTDTINVAHVFRFEIFDILITQSDDESLIQLQIKRNVITNLEKRLPLTKPFVAAAILDKRFMELKEIVNLFTF